MMLNLYAPLITTHIFKIGLRLPFCTGLALVKSFCCAPHFVAHIPRYKYSLNSFILFTSHHITTTIASWAFFALSFPKSAAISLRRKRMRQTSFARLTTSPKSISSGTTPYLFQLIVYPESTPSVILTWGEPRHPTHDLHTHIRPSGLRRQFLSGNHISRAYSAKLHLPPIRLLPLDTRGTNVRDP